MSEKIIHGRKAADIQRQHSTAIKHHKSTVKDSPADHILHLQRTVGNQAVQRLYKAGLIQAKLTVGAPNDAFEQEADRVADRVMRMPDPQLQREPLKEEDERLRKKELAGASYELGPDAEKQVQSLQGGGRPLPETVRAFMEPRFGVDFGSVRLHTDASAAESARAIDAQAYTLGRNIVFGEGRYAPDTSEGKHLLAHELTHVVQQGVGLGKGPENLSRTRQPTIQRAGIKLPSGVRALDPAEISIGRGVYGASLEYGDIYISDALGAGGRPFTLYVPILGTVIQMGPSAYGSPGSDPNTLVHEMAHSWQSQHHSEKSKYMTNSVLSQGAASVAGGSAYCYVPGKPFKEYAAEQIANQAEKGVASIRSHMSSVAKGSVDPDNVASLSVPRWEKAGAPGVVC